MTQQHADRLGRGWEAPPTPGRVHPAYVIACATVIAELLPHLPDDVGRRVLDFGLHVDPARLRTTLQAAVDDVSASTTGGDGVPTIVLGYGLCSQGVVGVRAEGCRLVIPKVDDCIAIFLGSRDAYAREASREPGTYYLTKGWIEVGSTPFAEFDQAVEHFGRERAEALYRDMLGHYTRLALIDTGTHVLAEAREYACRTAARFGLRFEEIRGSRELVRKMIRGPWSADEFVVCEPGGTVRLRDFMRRGGRP